MTDRPPDEALAERMHRQLWVFARDQTMDLYREAVRLGMIDGGQAEALMGLWIARHKYEPLEPERDANGHVVARVRADMTMEVLMEDGFVD